LAFRVKYKTGAHVEIFSKEKMPNLHGALGAKPHS